MPEGENIYQRLLDMGFEKHEIHSAFHKFIMYRFEQKKAYKKLSFFGKTKWHIRSIIARMRYFLLRKLGKTDF